MVSSLHIFEFFEKFMGKNEWDFYFWKSRGCLHDCVQRALKALTALTHLKRTRLLFGNQMDWAIKMNAISGKAKVLVK